MDFSNPNVEVVKKVSVNSEPRPEPKPTEFKEKNVNNSIFSEDKVREILFNKNKPKNNLCCMLVGKDGVGKSGLMWSYMTDEDIKNGYRCVIIDLDGGSDPIQRYHEKRCKKQNREWNDVFLFHNPIMMKLEKGSYEFDYISIFNMIKGIVQYVRNNWEKDKIKFIAFDGLSTALKYAENQMRLEKNLDADGGVSLRHWLIRNKLFMELVESIKAIPISKFYVAHENFILKDDKENSSVVEKTNAAMHQKIRCIRSDEIGKITFKAVIDKSKANITNEGNEVVFAEVNKTTKEYKWNAEKVFEGLI